MQDNAFVVIDVETANPDVSSICQIGLAHFENGVLKNEYETMVNPEDYFDSINVDIHGITYNNVRNSPKFPEIFDQLIEAFSDNVLLTYTAFDRSSINKASLKYKLQPITNTWLDCAKVVRRHWNEFSYRGYGLRNIADFIGLEFSHHKALEDAKAAGIIFNKILQDSNLNIDDWISRCNKKISLPTSIKSLGNPDGPYFGEYMVFTGALRIARSQAAKLASNSGFSVDPSVNKNTTVLVLGELDKSKLKDGVKSTKQKKAEDLIRKGQEIKIIYEDDFFELLKYT